MGVVISKIGAVILARKALTNRIFCTVETHHVLFGSKFKQTFILRTYTKGFDIASWYPHYDNYFWLCLNFLTRFNGISEALTKDKLFLWNLFIDRILSRSLFCTVSKTAKQTKFTSKILQGCNDLQNDCSLIDLSSLVFCFSESILMKGIAHSPCWMTWQLVWISSPAQNLSTSLSRR